MRESQGCGVVSLTQLDADDFWPTQSIERGGFFIVLIIDTLIF